MAEGICPTFPTTFRQGPVILDPVQKRLEMSLALLNPFQVSFPLPRHHRTLHFRMHHLDQMNPLIRSLEVLPIPNNVFAFQQYFDNRCPRGRRPQPRLLHRVRQLFLIQRLAGRLHRRQKRGFRKPLRRACLLADSLCLQHILRLPSLEAHGQILLLVILRLLAGFRFPVTGSLFPGLEIQYLPAHLLNGLSRRVISVGDRGRSR